MANEALITSELHPLLNTHPQLPDDVRIFLAQVHAASQARNESLFATLRDAVAALNAAGIEPVLLKGCGMWATRDGSIAAPSGDRLVSDLDLLVRPSETRRSIDALKLGGFAVLEDHEGDEDHAVAVLGRPQDAGSIDLHDRPPCPIGIAEIDNLQAHCSSVSIDRFKAKLPRAELQIVILTLHDQILDADYWMGGFHLRHLIDIAKLTQDAPRIDWSLLMALLPTKFLRSVLDIQLLAAKRIAAADIPPCVGSRAWTRMQYNRLRLQHTFPAINVPLRWFGRMIQWRNLPSRTRVFDEETRT
jgi:hypothetical protein